ncbi:14377_t:CDS:2 [Gigaspora margarita]|uniref:14377_t:CDS:1 n=1 Tax=Gigaspora margarita TaxID=4874 RepID=A0ABN7UK59_GIGMA|nr:14377_t:CDS:2 [Gigaspora margarita]
MAYYCQFSTIAIQYPMRIKKTFEKKNQNSSGNSNSGGSSKGGNCRNLTNSNNFSDSDDPTK